MKDIESQVPLLPPDIELIETKAVLRKEAQARQALNNAEKSFWKMAVLH